MSLTISASACAESIQSEQNAFLQFIELGDTIGMSTLWEKNDVLGRYRLFRSSNDKYCCSIHCAAISGQWKALYSLISMSSDRTNINCSGKMGDTPLMCAVQSGVVESVRILLQNRAEPLITNQDGKTALCLAAERGNEVMVKLIVKSACKDAKRFEWYIGKKLVSVWGLLSGNASLDLRHTNAEVRSMLKMLVWICEAPACKTVLLKLKVCHRFRVVSERPRICGCNQILLLHACVALICDTDANDLDAIHVPALHQFLEAKWLERGLQIMAENWVPGNQKQAIAMTAMHLLIAIFSHASVHQMEIKLDLAHSPSNAKGMKIFLNALGAYSYFQCATAYPAAVLRKKTGLMWLRFQYQIREELKRVLLRYPVMAGKVKEEGLPLLTKYVCECSEMQSSQLKVEKCTEQKNIGKNGAKDNGEDTDTSAFPEPDFRSRSESITIAKPYQAEEDFLRSSSFCDFAKLRGDEKFHDFSPKIARIWKSKALADGDWLPSDDDEYITNPPDKALAVGATTAEYSSCYYEAMSKIVRDISCGFNPVRSTERLDPFDLLHCDEVPPYLAKSFIERRANALLRQLTADKEEMTACSDAWKPTEAIQLLVRTNATRPVHQPPFSSARWQGRFEQLLSLSLDGGTVKVMTTSQKESLTLPNGKHETLFCVGRRQGAKMVLSLVEEIGKKPRGVVVKLLPRDDLADVCVKRLEYVMALAQFPVDCLVINYRLFLSDSSFWYLARPVCDWNLDELIDRFWQDDDSESVPPWNSHRVFYDCIKGLDFLHSRTPTIFHGNLKPTNILVDSNGTARLVDFGFGKVFTPAHELSCPCVISKTDGARVQFDSRCWKPLEYFKSEKHYICASDIQSVAMLGYYALSTGQSHPFVTTDEMDLKDMEVAISSGGYHLSRLVLPTEAVDLFVGMLAAEPTERLSATAALNHVYFWPVSRKASFILVTSCQPEVTLCFGSEPMLQTQISTINALKSIEMTAWTNFLPVSDPNVRPEAIFHRYLDDCALSFLLYIRAFYVKHGAQDPQCNLLSKFVMVFPQAFLDIFRVVKDSGWMTREAYADLQ